MAVDPRTSSIDRDGSRLVYQALEGGGEGHVVWYQELQMHLDLWWTDPTVAPTIAGMASDGLTSLILQERGVGLSDPVPRPATVEEKAADLLAVLDAEHIERATLAGTYSLGLPIALLAAQRPERVQGIVLIGTIMAGPRVTDSEYGWTPESARDCIANYEWLKDEWGRGESLRLLDPGYAAPYHLRLAAMAERSAAPKAFIDDAIENWISIDGREIFSQVQVPARVIGMAGWPFPLEAMRAVADAMPNAEFHELPPAELGDSFGTIWHPIARHAAEMARGADARFGTVTDRVLASVLFTDIVGSTDQLARRGDAEWAKVLTDLEVIVRREVARNDGRLVKSTGDGAMCEFAGPSPAIACARAICAAAPDLGIQVRAGLHAGECDRLGDDLAGMAVHVAARVCGAAGPGEVLVSRAVHDLVAGSETQLAPRGARELKGVHGPVELYAAGEETAQAAIPLEPQTRPLDRALIRFARRAPGTVRTLNRAGTAMQRGALKLAGNAPARRE